MTSAVEETTRFGNEKESRMRAWMALLTVCGIVLVSVVINLRKCERILSAKRMIAPDVISILQSDNDGNSPLLGWILYKRYPHDTVLTVAEYESDQWLQFYRFFRVDVMSLTAFAYPIAIRSGRYSCFVTPQECDHLKRSCSFSVKANNLTYYFSGSNSSSADRNLGLFMYRTDFFIAPLNWRETGGRQ